MASLTIVADIRAKADKIDLVRSELEKLVDPTRSEEGCIQYDLHLDNHDASHFLFFEIWESRELWQAHMAAPHLTAFTNATEGAVVEVVISEMSQIV